MQFVFLDVVEFTRSDRSEEDMVRIVLSLYKIVLSALEEADVSKEQAILLPTGDGLCIGLIDLHDHDIHIRLAHKIRSRVDRWSSLQERKSEVFLLRIAVHEHTDFVVQDLNGQDNIFGHGINTAARLMTLCDPGHIVVSAVVHERTHRAERYQQAYGSPLQHWVKGHNYTYYSLGPGLGEGASLLETIGRLKARIGPKLTLQDIAGLKAGDRVYHSVYGLGVLQSIAPGGDVAHGRHSVIKFRDRVHTIRLTNAKGNYHRWT